MTKMPKQRIKKGRPKKETKYTKTMSIRFTASQWLKILNSAEKSHLEPSVFLRKLILDTLEKE